MPLHFVVAHAPDPETRRAIIRFPFQTLSDSSPLYICKWENPGPSESVSGFSDGTDILRSFFSILHSSSPTDGPRQDILFFIHGYQTSWSGLRKLLKRLESLYVLPPQSPIKHIVLFHWPSKNKISFSTYREERLDAIDSGWALSQFLYQWAHFRLNSLKSLSNIKINLLCHSMGNYLFQNTIDFLSPEIRSFSGFFSHILLAAADVDWNVFEVGNSLSFSGQLCERLTVYYNTYDHVLWLAEQQHRRPRLGRQGPSNMDEIILKGIDKDRLHFVQAGKTDPFRSADPREGLLHHWYYYANPIVVDDIRAVLFTLSPQGRHSHSTSGGCFVLKQ